MEERRSISRCDVCSGPTKYVGEILKCRNSMCAFNHKDVKCPRCESKGPEVQDFKDDKFAYSCKECLNQWSQ